MDPVRRDLLGQRFRKTLQRPLRCVVRTQIRERRDTRYGGDLDDVAALLGAHDRQRSLGNPQCAKEVGVQLATGLGFGQLFNEPELTIARVVDDDVKLTEVLVCRTHRAEGPRPISDVKPDPKQQIVEFILFLERETGRDILAENLDPGVLRTLNSIYANFFASQP